MTDHSRFIPGIYNYCDRWCERCTFALRCRNFDMAQEFEEMEAHDPENEKFWEGITQNFEETMEFLDEGVDEYDFDVDEEEYLKFREEEERQEAIARQHPVATLSKYYIDQVDQWMDAAEATLKEKDAELHKRGEIDAEGMEPFVQVVAMEDAVEVINWYTLFIHVKLMRALRGREESDAMAEEYDFPKDSDGSAKIALIGIDRSIGAWGTLYKLLPDLGGSILDQLTLLNKLRRDVEHEFPDARAFQRAGFDYMPDAE